MSEKEFIVKQLETLNLLAVILEKNVSGLEKAILDSLSQQRKNEDAIAKLKEKLKSYEC